MEKSLALLASRDEPLGYDRRKFAAEMAHLLSTPGYTTDKSALKERGLQEFKMEQATQPKTEEEQALETLAVKMTEAMQACKETFMLSAPVSLTVRKSNGSYSKMPHVGMEDFQPLKAYLGKRGKMIFVFKPVMVAEYVEMEMDEQQAFSNLGGFKPYLQETVGDLQKLQSEIKVEMAKKAEEAKLADRYDTYKDIGFGSW